MPKPTARCCATSFKFKHVDVGGGWLIFALPPAGGGYLGCQRGPGCKIDYDAVREGPARHRGRFTTPLASQV